MDEQTQPRWDHAAVEETLGTWSSPLTVDVVDHTIAGWWEAIAQLAGIPARRWRTHHPAPERGVVALIQGHPAMDRAAWERLASLMPGATALPSRTADMLGVGRDAIKPPGRAPHRTVDLWRARRMRRALRRAEGSLDADLARFRSWLRREVLEPALAPSDAGVAFQQLPTYALAARLESALASTSEWRTTAVIELASAAAHSRAQRMLTDLGRAPGPAFLELARASSGAGAADPDHAAAIAALARERDPHHGLDNWLALYGWHAMSDLRLEDLPFVHQRPAVVSWLDQEVARCVAGAAPEHVPPEPVNLDGFAPDVRDELLRVRRLTGLRESIARDRADLHAVVRALTWTIASRLAHEGTIDRPEHVFALSVPELLIVCRGGDVPAPDVLARRLVTGPDPEAAVVPIAGAGAPQVQLMGIPVSSGTASGSTLVLETPEADAMAEGTVLVCRATDPGWLPLMMRASAIVTERGGPLSHAAIVARELGIPAVVAVRGARSCARSHARAHVNGDSGIIDFELPHAPR